MRILVTAANGFLGSALVPYLEGRGHTVIRLVRRTERNSDIGWRPERAELDSAKLVGFDAIIHLAGANIAGRRWSESYQKEIYDSRIKSTELLVKKISTIASFPRTFISMSGIGYYGSCGDRLLDESSPAGDDFMARLAIDWEQAALPLAQQDVRVISLRTGVVLSPTGGALAKMLPAFRWGLGGRLGTGNQYWSWISLTDFLAAVVFILNQESITGPVNMTAPNPVTNCEFTKTLAQTLHRPAIFPVPATLLRILFGEMADAVFFASQRVIPRKLDAAGLSFSDHSLKSAIERMLTSDSH